MTNFKQKIDLLKKEFLEWPSATFHGLELENLDAGKATGRLRINPIVFTPHPLKLVNGLMIATTASMVGVYAVRTLIDDEYPVLDNTRPIKLKEFTIPIEKSLFIETWVSNDRAAQKDKITLVAKITSVRGRHKATFIFDYKIVPKKIMENKICSLADSLTAL